MTFEVWADPGFDKELAKFSEADRERIEQGIIAFSANPVRHPKATRLAGARIVQSFRLRVGTFQVMVTLLPPRGAILVTTVCREKRGEDYDAALSRHEQRLLAQVPPISDYLDDLGF